MSSERAYANPFVAQPHETKESRADDGMTKQPMHEEKRTHASFPPRMDASAMLHLLCTHMAAHLAAIRADFPLPTPSPSTAHHRVRDEDPFVYEGVAGIAYMCMHIEDAAASSMTNMHGDTRAQRAIDAIVAEAAQLALPYASHAADLLRATPSSSRHPLPVTFYCGAGGVLAILALASLRRRDTTVLERSVDQLIHLIQERLHATTTDLPDEILYGRAGLMHAALMVEQRLARIPPLTAGSSGSPSADRASALRALIDLSFDQIVSRGVAYPNKPHACPLMWEWHGKRYLGAAHGVTGILYLLMHVSWRLTSTAPDASKLRSLILGTLDYCISVCFESGNLPSSIAEPDSSAVAASRDRLVQWCHGAPGLVLACLHAASVFGMPVYASHACRIADVIWHRGLLKKGLGLCHGIGGNGYVFLKLYESTGDGVYLDRAMSFAQFGLTSPFVDELIAQPDVPASLANGRAGFICFMVELIHTITRPTQASTTPTTHVSLSPSAAASSAHAVAPPSSTSLSDACHVPPSAVRRVCFPGMDFL